MRLLIFLLAILIPAYESSSPAFHMMYSTYKLNNQGNDIQPWRTPFPILNQSIVPYPVLTVASCLAYRLLGYPHLFKNFPQLVVIHTVKGFSIVNEAEIDYILNSLAFSVSSRYWICCGSSAFSKPSFYIWNSWFTYCWSIAWRILSIILLTCEMSAIVW